jgi:YHS domain-containing protein
LLIVIAGCSSRAPSSAATAQTDHTQGLIQASAASTTPTSGTSKLERVEASRVCMVNDHYMGKEQIPVTVDGRTYYGCCPMCKDRLARDASARTATDPLSQRPVDKARAVIAKAATGDVMYFESEDTLARFVAQPR